MPIIDLTYRGYPGGYLPYPWYPYSAPHPAYDGYTTTSSNTTTVDTLSVKELEEVVKGFDERISKLEKLVDKLHKAVRVPEHLRVDIMEGEPRVSQCKFCGKIVKEGEYCED